MTFMIVSYYQRKPRDNQNFSIERVFEAVRSALPSHVNTKVVISRYESSGLFRRLFNILESPFSQGDVNHVTGDIHYLTYLLKKKKTILTVHDCAAIERLAGWRKKVYLLLWFQLPELRSAMCSAISESTKKELLKYLKCDPNKIKVIYDPLMPNFRPVPKICNSIKPVILHIGTGDNKNLIRLSQALKGISCHLRIIGILSNMQMEALAENGIEYSSVSNLTDESIVAEYENCDLLAFVSTYEGFGLPIVEANAVGRPVITSNVYSMPEIAGEAACIVDPYHVHDIRAGVLRVIDDEDYRQDLIEKGFRNISRFQPHVIASQYLTLYNQILNSSC